MMALAGMEWKGAVSPIVSDLGADGNRLVTVESVLENEIIELTNGARIRLLRAQFLVLKHSQISANQSTFPKSQVARQSTAWQ